MLTDITARKSTAEAMHLCDKALAATSEATLITDCSKPDNPIIYCNDGFTKLFGPFLLRSDALHAYCCVAVSSFQYDMGFMAFFLCGSPRVAWCHTWKRLKGQHLLLLLGLLKESLSFIYSHLYVDAAIL